MLVWSWISFSITFNINGNKDIALLEIGLSFAILQELGNFPELIKRLHKSVIDLTKTFVPSFKKWPDRLSKPAALDALVFFKIIKMVFSGTVARSKELLWIMPL